MSDGHVSAGERFERYMEAVKAKDLDRAFAHYAEDFAFRLAGSDSRVGKAGMIALLEWDFAVDSEHSWTILEEDGDELRLELKEMNDFYRLLDLSPRRVRMTCRFEGDQLAEQVIEETLYEGHSHEAALEPVIAWAKENRPEEIESLHPIVFDGTSARRWIALLEAWHRASR